MTAARTVRQAPHDPFGTFSHDPDRIDPNLLAVEPDEPYTLLAPDIEIMEGDIRRVVGEGERWAQIETHEVGYKTPCKGIAYARVAVPEGYTLAGPTCRLGVSDLIWTSADPQWRVAGEAFGGSAELVGEVARMHRENLNQLFFVAQIDLKKVGQRILEVPPRHRGLFPGEVLRRGDKLAYDGLREWAAVTEAAFGQRVEMPSGMNGNARFCRPVHHNQQNWYVDEEKGKPEFLGGSSDPWPSLRVAQDKIEKAARDANLSPYGLIWSSKGIPLMAYDLPEPPAPRETLSELEQQAEVVAELQKGAAAAQPAVEDVINSGLFVNKPPKVDKVAPPSEWGGPPVEKRARTMSEQIVDQCIATEDAKFLEAISATGTEAKRTLPQGYRLMSTNEEVRKGDLGYLPYDDDLTLLMWQPATAETQGNEVSALNYYFARKMAPRMASKAEALLNEVYAAHRATEEAIKQLREHLQALR